MANKIVKKFAHLEKVIAKKYKGRDKKIGKPQMKVSGKSAFELQRLASNSRAQRAAKIASKKSQ